MLSALGIVVIMVVIVADVISRTTTGGSLVGAFPLVEETVTVTVFLAIAYGERTKTHVRISLLTNRLPGPVAMGARLIAHAVALLITAWIFKACLGSAMDSFEIREFHEGPAAFPIWPTKMVVVFGAGLLFLEFLASTIKVMFGVEQKDPEIVADDPTSIASTAGVA
ncbi:TRAP transporter small permease [Nocardioides sp. AE5]|uniref:TRAP transporter small permease n=1 Tax=Nocardioides sp. AE5 TaxID=2962573 RepID=UPI002881B5E7|nr:TRAP transporter small permease [Nocardioides sp. AE5]MDT0202620.1 TRAP transporter small permease [Nocardioides sp. AE5]